jgi:aerobic carbon-monoxide dehydrogenase medium subunit
MKPAPFEYAAPTSVAEAVALLAANPGSAKLLAGGQTLMPVLAFRLAAPSLLVDLGKVPGLNRIDIGADGVRLGACVRWRDIEDDARLRDAHPLLVQAVSHVAHYQIRNRGTVGGSLAHADPAAEMPGIAVTCDAELKLIGPAGSRTVAASGFFQGALSTVLAEDEVLVEVRLPPWPEQRRWAFEEFARRRGDFALAAVALYYDVDAAGHASNAHVGVIGACHCPHRLTAVEAVLNGRAIDAATISAAAAAAEAALDAPSDLHAPGEYRRALYASLLETALGRAAR